MSHPNMYHGRQQWPGQELRQDLNHLQDPRLLHEHTSAKYGSQPLYPVIKEPNSNWRRRRLNLPAIFICLFVPWLMFCFTMWLLTFKQFYRAPAACWVVAILALLFICWLGHKAVEAFKSRYENGPLHEPTWLIFLFITSLIAWGLGMYVGYWNYFQRMESYYSLSNLGNYAGVDPKVTPGQQLMDGGRIVFKDGTHLDLSKAMSFRNNELYCVAPIVSANYTLGGAPESYDYWAVGINCCCGDTVRDANFQCGEYNNLKATAGVRLMRDQDRPFFRLAVRQAEGAYGIKANHPLFLHWVEDPTSATESYRWEGHRRYLMGAYLHFIFQFVLVALTTCCFMRTEGDDEGYRI